MGITLEVVGKTGRRKSSGEDLETIVPEIGSLVVGLGSLLLLFVDKFMAAELCNKSD